MIAVLIVFLLLIVAAITLLFVFCFNTVRDIKRRDESLRFLIEEMRKATDERLHQQAERLTESGEKLREIDGRLNKAAETVNKAFVKASMAETKTRVEEALRDRLARRRLVSDGAASTGWRQ